MFKPRMAALAGALMFGALAICGGALAAADDWRTYSNAELGLSTSFPSPPTVEKRSDPATADTAQAEVTSIVSSPDESRNYRLEIDRIVGGRTADPEALLDALPSVLSERLKMPVASQQRFTYQGYLALDLLLGPDKDNIYFRGRYIVRDSDLIQIVSVRQGGPPPIDRLFTDFKFEP